jgi:SAM-dependent methyltransferase
MSSKLSRMFVLFAAIAAMVLLVASPSDLFVRSAQAQATAEKPKLDVHFVPTPHEVVDAMLKMAKVTKDDVVYDLGCGDGRIVIAAAKQYGARGVGIDLDPDRIKEARENAEKAGVTDKVKFIEGDLFQQDLSDASVVTLYLLSELNMRLRPKLFKELRPGSRVVSHSFSMGDWQPKEQAEINNNRIYFWVIPEKSAQKTE